MKLSYDMKTAKADLTHLEKQEFPFVYAKTLTQTAEAARQAVGIQTRRKFKLNSEFIPKNIKKTPAKMLDIVKYGLAVSEVLTGRKLDGWMGQHETGGIKTPKGKAIAIPAKGLAKRPYRTKSGRIQAGFKPKRLLAEYKKSKKRKRKSKLGGADRGSPFITKSKKRGSLMIIRRLGAEQDSVEVLYIFTRRSLIRRRWGFRPAVVRTANAVFKKKFDKNMALALKD